MGVFSHPIAVLYDKQVVYPTKILTIATMSVGQTFHRSARCEKVFDADIDINIEKKSEDAESSE